MRKRGIGFIASAGLVVLVAVGVWHLFVHRSNDLKPAVVTPKMNVHNEFSNDVGARLYRIEHATIPRNRKGYPKLIALTFDDGPYPIFTPLLLDTLRTLQVPGTFFLIGRDAQQWPAITQRIEADRNEIGDHTFSHPDLDKESPAQVSDEILHGSAVLWALSHDPGTRTLMRPPHGRYTEATLHVAQSLHYHVILWTDDAGDWRDISAQTIESHVLAHATAPEIVLLHSGKAATVEALPMVVARFRRAGYVFVTVSQLLQRVRVGQINHPARHAV